MAQSIFKGPEELLTIDVPKEKRYLNTVSYDYSVEFLNGLMLGDHPKIVLEVPFQRKYIWKNDRASQLIESIIMNVPIPPLYFAEEEDGRWLVVDGLQRLYSIMNYFQNEYGLKSLEIIKELKGCKFKDLPPKPKNLLKDGLMRINVIKKDSHPDIKYDIFMRLNKGSATLNYQELRNCLYRGVLNDAAKELTKTNQQFLDILKQNKPHDRFLDVEFIIRFFAFDKNLRINEKGEYCLQDYGGSLVSYINTFMNNNKNISTEEKKELVDKFNLTIAKVVEVFGTEKAFRDLTLDSGKVNRAIADFIMLSFAKIQEDELIKKREDIKRLLVRLLPKMKNLKNQFLKEHPIQALSIIELIIGLRN
jgi:Protein of unknown function DUF262.